MEERCIDIQVYASLSRRLDCAAQCVNNDVYRDRNNHYKTITIKEYFNNSMKIYRYIMFYSCIAKWSFRVLIFYYFIYKYSLIKSKLG